MFTTSHYYQDFLNPTLCLQLLGMGVTDQTPFYWALDKTHQLAALHKNRGNRETDLANEGLCRVPAYSVGALLSVFPAYRLIKNRTEYVLELPLPFQDDIHIEKRGPILSYLVYETIQAAILSKSYPLLTINIAIHQFNAQPYA